MKQGKKPTRKQRENIRRGGLNPDNWLIYKNNGERVSLVHRNTGTKRQILKDNRRI
ncbi:DUF6906 family protein [Niallia taxi]|uniref:DUF6906 family protein n=1 Tax=Niallia taxi TaxID=2499688 RepID=UPI00254E9534|nr:hypothetical protein [Niallia taxi]MDK8641310.1 hypothetical protein [Niallia taxi]